MLDAMEGTSFLAGLLIGVVGGLLLGSALRFALTVREWRRASREAAPADEVVRMMAEPEGSAPGSSSDPIHLAGR
jgi:hypothetical protein